MTTFWRDTVDVKFKDGDVKWIKKVAVEYLEGSSAGQSGALGSLTVAEIEFYRRLTNSITTFFHALANVNNFVVRYENDPRDTPDISWLEIRIDFGKAKQFEIRGEEDNIRCPGIFNVIIHIPIGMGSADALDIADIISAKFRTVIIDKIINFQTPRIENVGRYEDAYLVTVICPFFADKIYSML